MNTTHVFGGALINISVTPLSEETPHDPGIDVALAAFLSMMNKSYVSGAEDRFREIMEVFLDEVDVYLDDRLLAKSPEAK